MIPGPLLAELRRRAVGSTERERPRPWAAAWVIVGIWLGLAGVAAMAILRMYWD